MSKYKPAIEKFLRVLDIPRIIFYGVMFGSMPASVEVYGERSAVLMYIVLIIMVESLIASRSYS